MIRDLQDRTSRSGGRDLWRTIIDKINYYYCLSSYIIHFVFRNVFNVTYFGVGTICLLLLLETLPVKMTQVGLAHMEI